MDRNHCFDIHVALNDVKNKHDGPCAESDLTIEAAKYSLAMIHVAQVVWILPLLSEELHQLVFVFISYTDEFAKESCSFELLIDLVLVTGSVFILTSEFFDLVQQWSQQLQMRQPLGLIVDVFGDESAQITVTVVDPFAWIHSWLNQNKRLIQERVEFFERAIRFLQKDISL